MSIAIGPRFKSVLGANRSNNHTAGTPAPLGGCPKIPLAQWCLRPRQRVVFYFAANHSLSIPRISQSGQTIVLAPRPDTLETYHLGEKNPHPPGRALDFVIARRYAR